MKDWTTREHGLTEVQVSGEEVPKKRGAEPAICALPGCDVTISQLPGGRPRTFCGSAHPAAARQQRVDEALQAAALAGDRGVRPDDAPQPEPAGGAGSVPGLIGRADGAAPTPQRRSRGPAGRRVLAGVTVLALVAGIVPAVLLLASGGSRTAASRPAVALGGHPRAPATESAQYRLLARSGSWSVQAQHALAGIRRQLSALVRAAKAIEAVPAGQRSAKADALLRRIRRQITLLARDQGSLSVGLAAWGTYQRSALELAGVWGELGYLRHVQQQTRYGRGAGGDITGLTGGLARDQKILTSQVARMSAPESVLLPRLAHHRRR